MKALVVGAGSIGLRHIENLRALLPGAAITVWHQHRKPADAPALDGIARVYTLDDALAVRPNIAVISGPAPSHASAAIPFAAQGVHLFVEKPIATTLDDADALIDACARHGVALLVGYNLRFSRSLAAMKHALDQGRIGRVLGVRAEVGQYLPDWRPAADYRQSVSARAELGGGVLLELSHEIDYVRWLAGDVVDVFARADRLSDLQIDVEDAAEIVLGFANGAVGSVHLDMIQRAPARTCRVHGSEGTLAWDGLRHHLSLYSAVDRAWTDLHPAQEPDRNESYIAELRHFLACAGGHEAPLVTGADARAVLQIALAARASSISRSSISL